MKAFYSKRLLNLSGCAVFLLVLALILGCGSKKSSSFDSKKGTKVNELTAISVDDAGSDIKLSISARDALSPNVFKLTDPLRVIIDLTDTRLGDVKGPIEVNNGIVNEITTSQFDDVTSSLSRIVIGFDKTVEYDVQTVDNSLTIVVPKSGVVAKKEESEEDVLDEVPTADDVLAEAPEVEEVPQEAAEIPEVAENDFPEIAPLETMETEEPVAEATPEPVEAQPMFEETTGPATKIEDIQFESSDMGTTVYITTDGEIGEWDDFVLESPTRLVVDLKGIKNAFSTRKRIPIGSTEVEQLRIGEYRDKVRLVLDYPSDKRPSYTVNKENKRLVLNIVPPSGETFAESTPEEPATEVPIEEDVVAEKVEEEPVEDIPEVAVMPEESPAEEIYVEPQVDTAPAPKATVTSVDFKQMPGEQKSRLVIGTTNPVVYNTREEGAGTVIIELSNTNIPNTSLRRFLDTSEFASAVSRVTPTYYSSDNRSVFSVKLRDSVQYRTYQEGNLLYIDFDIPQGMNVAQAKAAPPKQEAPQAVSEEPEQILSEDVPEELEEVAKDKWSPVKEEFLSDRLQENAPLTAMGSVLAETYGGKRRFVGRRISLDFKNAELRSIFRLLAEVSKFNMIIGDDVGGRITVRLENVPWDQAFAIILQTKGLWYEKYGNIVRIAPAEKLKKEREMAVAAQRAAIEVKPMDVLFKPISYATAGDISNRVKPILSSRGTVDIDSRTNTLIIRDVKEYLEAAKSLIEKLDTQTPQVSIEARIVEANTRSRQGWGIKWSGSNAQFGPTSGNPTGIFFPNTVDVTATAMDYPSPVGANSVFGIKMGSINNVVNLDLTIEMMESSGDGKLISSPKVTVLDNSTATIMSGTKIPYITQTGNSGSNVRFENAVISLTVSPHITSDGSVFMKINATRNEPDQSIVIDGNPGISQRVVTTEVLVKSGNTTVLGGIYKINKERSRESFPFLSKIPLLGYLFKNWGREVNKEELLIFITPRIVGDERVAIKDIRG